MATGSQNLLLEQRHDKSGKKAQRIEQEVRDDRDVSVSLFLHQPSRRHNHDHPLDEVLGGEEMIQREEHPVQHRGPGAEARRAREQETPEVQFLDHEGNPARADKGNAQDENQLSASHAGEILAQRKPSWQPSEQAFLQQRVEDGRGYLGDETDPQEGERG